MNVGTAVGGYKWIADVNQNKLPERSEVGKQKGDVFSQPLTETDCATLGLVLLDEYSITNFNDLVTTLNAVNNDAALLFKNASALFKQNNFSAAQAEFDRAALRYTEARELYTVLIAIAEVKTMDVPENSTADYKLKSDATEQNIRAAQQNSLAASASQAEVILVAEDTALVDKYRQASVTYNTGVSAYNAQQYAEAATTFSTVHDQVVQILAALTV